MKNLKLLAILLCFTLVFTAGGAAAFAAGNTAQNIVAPTFRSVCYHSGLSDVADYTRTLLPGGTFDEYWSGWDAPEGLALAGWATAENGAIAYDLGGEIPADTEEVWAVWAPLCLGDDEIFSFNNSSRYFEADGREKYYMREEDYNTMQYNLYKNFGVGPVPSPILSIVLATYPDWEWQGSCYGMSAVAALQHFGKINALSQQNAASLSELEATDELISYLNYYQSQVATSWLTENKAYVVGTPLFRAQTQRMFESVKAGNLAIFTFYQGNAFVTPGHAVLLVGAYDAADGSHVIVAYDCNRPWEYEAGEYSSRFVISPDYSGISYDGETLGAINWTDNFDQITSFAIDRSGNPFVWYRAFFRHIADLFNTFVKMFRLPAA